jgi:hypothetical protein
VQDLSEGLLPYLQSLGSLPFLGSAPGRLLGALLNSIEHPGQPVLHSQRELGTTPLDLRVSEAAGEAPPWPQAPGME